MITLFSLGILSQVIVAIVSGVTLTKFKLSFSRFLFLFLLITAFIEVYCFFLLRKEKPTFIFHHIYSFIEYSLIFWMYLKLIKEKKWLILPKLLWAVIVILWLIVFFYRNIFSYLIILGSINVAIVLLLYLRGVLLSDEILNYKKMLPFWVSVGFLVFYLPSIPFFSLLKYIKSRGIFSVLSVLIILRSLFISFGLIWSKEEKY
ncbi:hypothetical protein SAMN04489761_4607 [Tenacibaculum sp. MAR_2009_124]|nr:hypothetical protein SAMN04489761_4607 [Tenacibaculum sp. MAR_2009_124]